MAIGRLGNYDNQSTHSNGIIIQTASISLPENRTWQALQERIAISGNAAYRVTVPDIRDDYEPVLSEYTLYNFDGNNRYGKVSHFSSVQRVKYKVESRKVSAKLNYSGGGGLSHGKTIVEKIH
ncbi:hypothetical protein J8L98_08715 [Pseudoalteromonas sp. MMG013]|uniref:hypothetical protein n=1 Tax=Pseudoalteromonas sp. MMG013 TaxID=2822687 RepID=UPI001B38F6EB|nr:hypothetical protein [Pseudoalteromonas sp. MMG013]MBQ4861774.1 hypothetical protein [Pseudoalteromonas sp. MMG013]